MQMSARMKQEAPPLTELDALTVTTMATQTQGIPSPMTPPSGLTETVTTVATTQTGTTQTNSLTTPLNGRTPMAMGVATIQTASTVMLSGKIQTNGKTVTVTATVIISSTVTAMVFPKATLTCARLCLVSQPTHSPVDVRTTTAMVSSIQSMPSGKTRSNGQIPMVTVTATTALCQAVMTVPMCSVNPSKTTDKAALTQTSMVGLTSTMHSLTTPSNGSTQMAMAGATTMHGSTIPLQTSTIQENSFKSETKRVMPSQLCLTNGLTWTVTAGATTKPASSNQMHSRSNQLNGTTLMAMVLATGS